MGIISILEAEKLFDKYLYGTNNDKDNIILKTLISFMKVILDLLENKFGKNEFRQIKKQFIS